MEAREQHVPVLVFAVQGVSNFMGCGKNENGLYLSRKTKTWVMTLANRS